ncbi:MAG: sarcosine oxidase subunit gamma [Pseudomonadota bacterium]
MVDRISALAGLEMPLEFGPDLAMAEHRPGSIWQITAWPDRLAEAGAAAAMACGADAAPGPLTAVDGAKGELLRIDPVRWLWVGETAQTAPDIGGAGTVLDLSHARTVIRITGARAPDLMARMVPLDLRPTAFGPGRVATSGIHHVAVTLQGRENGVDLYCFRSFGRAIWEHLTETAAQFALA